MPFRCTCLRCQQLKNVGSGIFTDYQGVVWGFIGLIIVENIINALMDTQLQISRLYLAICLLLLRTAVRRTLNIPGDGCTDCLVSVCCTPCAITQIVGQLWIKPEERPGCDFSEKPAELL